ncbi:MAG TPA: hypothetical protein VNR38_24810 [Ureibacillus sp.]|nr:hypothetical protein [Ureibacillus sp.]
MNETHKKYKRATVKIPTLSPSNHEVRIKRNNAALMEYLEKLQYGPFKIKKWFKRT